MYKVDLNCDVGESFGAYSIGADAEILQFVTSANIACGFHAGDPQAMRRTTETALALGVRVGAHPGLPDLIGFGRRTMEITPTEAYNLIIYQTGALDGFARQAGSRLHHVKPHGALYNMAARNAELAAAIATAVKAYDPELILFGLSGSESIRAAERIGLRAVSEVFADRTYQHDGSLTPRQHSNSLITDHTKAAEQALRMVINGEVTSLQNTTVAIRADSICVHGDMPDALSLVRHLRSALEAAGINVCAPCG